MGVSLTELGKSNHHKHLLYSRFPNDNSAKLQSKRLKIFLLSGNFLTIQPGFATDPQKVDKPRQTRFCKIIFRIRKPYVDINILSREAYLCRK